MGPHHHFGYIIKQYPYSYMLFLAFAAVVVIAFIYVDTQGNPVSRPKSRRKVLLTKYESEFFQRLCSLLPGYQVFPQALSNAVLKPLRITGQRNSADPSPLAGYITSFVVCTPGFEVVCVVVLDEKTEQAAHYHPASMVAIPTLRFHASASLSDEALRLAVASLP